MDCVFEMSILVRFMGRCFGSRIQSNFRVDYRVVFTNRF